MLISRDPLPLHSSFFEECLQMSSGRIFCGEVLPYSNQLEDSDSAGMQGRCAADVWLYSRREVHVNIPTLEQR